MNYKALDIAEEYEFEVRVLVIEDEIDDDAYEWAEYFYEEYDMGYGPTRSGLLLFLSMYDRDYAFVAYGYGNTAFTDHGKDVLLDKHVLPLLKQDEYYEAFDAYLDVAVEYLEMARDGAPFDTDTDPNSASLVQSQNLALSSCCPFLLPDSYVGFGMFR